MLNSRVPPATAGVMFLSGGLSELDSTLYLNAMNQSPNPWHLSFSYARALQNTVLKTWAGDDSRKAEAQAILGHRAKENGLAQPNLATLWLVMCPSLNPSQPIRKTMVRTLPT